MSIKIAEMDKETVRTAKKKNRAEQQKRVQDFLEINDSGFTQLDISKNLSKTGRDIIEQHVNHIMWRLHNKGLVRRFEAEGQNKKGKKMVLTHWIHVKWVGQLPKNVQAIMK